MSVRCVDIVKKYISGEAKWNKEKKRCECLLCCLCVYWNVRTLLLCDTDSSIVQHTFDMHINTIFRLLFQMKIYCELLFVVFGCKLQQNNAMKTRNTKFVVNRYTIIFVELNKLYLTFSPHHIHTKKSTFFRRMKIHIYTIIISSQRPAHNQSHSFQIWFVFFLSTNQWLIYGLFG